MRTILAPYYLSMKKSPVVDNPPTPHNQVTLAPTFDPEIDFKSSLNILSRAKILLPLAIASGLLALQLVALVIWIFKHELSSAIVTLFILTLIGACGLGIAVWRLHQGLLRPLQILEEKIERICQGGSRINLDAKQIGGLSDFAEIVQDLNDELTDLYEDMDNRVAQQTKRLAQKTASLKILYEAIASINQPQDLHELLIRYLRILKEMVNGRSATARLISKDGQQQLLVCIDTNNQILTKQKLLPMRICHCGQILIPGNILCNQNPKQCSKRLGRPMYGPDAIECLNIPLDYHDEQLGTYQIWVDRPGVGSREDILELLVTIGSHLGMAIAKQRSDTQARQLSIVQERTSMAHELHDSLAQTLASLRFRVRLLQESLEQIKTPPIILQQLQQINTNLDDANIELRHLIGNFRAPLNQGGLLLTIEKLVTKFKQDTGILAFLQHDCPYIQLTAMEETQMLRIIQEILTNIRKHAQAKTVRILLRCQGLEGYVLLVEDDGKGFQHPTVNRDGSSGEHLGLAIIQERAQRIGAKLRIDSELGEGTRVEFIFKPEQRSQNLGVSY